MNKVSNKNRKLPMTLYPWLIAVVCIFLASCNYFESEQSKLLKAKKLYEDNKFNKSIFMAKAILQADSKNCEARILLGKSQFAKFSLVDAEDSFEKAKKQGCKDVQLFYFSVKTQLYMNRLKNVESLFADKAFLYALNKPESILLEGDLSFLHRNYEKADEFYTKYYNLTHDEATNCLSQVKLLAMKYKYNEVISKTQACESSYANDKKYNIDQSRYLRAIAQVNTKHAQEAAITLNGLLSQYSNHKDPNIKIQSALLLMKINLAQKDIENANKMADVLLKYIATPDIYYVKGLKAEKENRFDLAEQQFLSALKLNPNHRPSLLQMANIKFKENNIEQAKYYTGKADSLSGKNIFTERLDELLAIKYLQAGDLDSIINKIPHDKNGSSRKSQYILALAYAKKGERDKAWKVFQSIKKGLSNTEQADLLEARLNVALGDLDKAEAIFKKYAQSGNAYAVTGLTQIYMRERKYQQAETLLKHALQKPENKYNTTILLVELYANTGQKQKIFDLLNNSIKTETKNEEYKVVLAKVYYKYAMYQDAIRLSGEIIQSNPNNIIAYVIKANSYVRLDESDKAAAAFKDLLTKDPNSAYSYLMLAFLADKQSQPEKAIQYIDKSLEINPQYINAIYAKVEFLLKEKKSQEAIEFAKSAANRFTQKRIGNLLLGFAYGKTGDNKNAYLSYKGALDDGSQDVRVAMKMYKASVVVNGEKIANEELNKFLNQNSKLKNIYYVANYFMTQKNYKQAEKYYETFVEKQQNNAVVFNNLAWLKMQDGDNKTALDYANKALALAPNAAAIMDTLGQILMQSGEYDKAGSYLLKASQKMADNPSVKYHLAQYYFHKNDFEKSRELLKQIENSDFEEQMAAKELLKKVSSH